MKFIIECTVISEIQLPRSFELLKAGRSFIFQIDEQNLWNRLKVIAPVTDLSCFDWGMEPEPEPRAPNQAPYKVHALPDPALLESVTSDVQCLESTISVFYPLRSIDWRRPTMRVEVGPEDDPKWGDLISIQVQPSQLPPVLATEKDLMTISLLAFTSAPLAVIQSFWREAGNHFANGQFINAFFNYYFVLEGFYGNQKTKNAQIRAEFIKSKGLHESIDQFMQSSQLDRRLTQLYKLLPNQTAMTATPDHESLIALLVSMRGTLHHFTNNTKRVHGSPLNHHEYEGLAVFAQFLAHKALVAATLENHSKMTLDLANTPPEQRPRMRTSPRN